MLLNSMMLRVIAYNIIVIKRGEKNGYTGG